MSARRKTVEDEFARLFPTRRAWKPADEAVDTLDPSLPFSAFVDAWVAAYKAAGGKTVTYDD